MLFLKARANNFTYTGRHSNLIELGVYICHYSINQYLKLDQSFYKRPIIFHSPSSSNEPWYMKYTKIIPRWAPSIFDSYYTFVSQVFVILSFISSSVFANYPYHYLHSRLFKTLCFTFTFAAKILRSFLCITRNLNTELLELHHITNINE